MIFKHLLLIFIFQIVVFGNSAYNSSLLDFQTKVFPKIVISDSNIEKKLINDNIVFTILYEEIDLNTAQIIKEKIENNYTNLKEYNVEVKLQKYDTFMENNLSSAYYFLLGKREKISQISQILTQNSRLSFAYDDRYLDLGVIFSLKIGQKVDIILKLEALKKSKIELQNSIFNVVIIR